MLSRYECMGSNFGCIFDSSWPIHQLGSNASCHFDKHQHWAVPYIILQEYCVEGTLPYILLRGDIISIFYQMFAMDYMHPFASGQFITSFIAQWMRCPVPFIVQIAMEYFSAYATLSICTSSVPHYKTIFIPRKFDSYYYVVTISKLKILEISISLFL